MTKKSIRVRFAPAPTGIMHIGNVRTALLNYLFSKQEKGTFVLRIEDTDPARNFDPSAQTIIGDLLWLNLDYDEGPGRGGAYEPYFQSERTPLYQQKLLELEKNDKVYRCFCSEELLEKKRIRQQALKLPPRYDRVCLQLSPEQIKEKITAGEPFLWRVKLDQSQKITITDLARGPITFEYQHFTDFPITRRDGTFTFMFANAIDDIVMQMTHVFRGEDHLSNTASQAAIYQAFGAPLPIFWHMPILCNIDGKKLSKRDKGFSLHDLRNEGYLPEAINNYLAIIGGSFTKEIMSLDELASTFPFNKISPAGQIKYDVEKLTWVNRQWIEQYDPKKLLTITRPFLKKTYSIDQVPEEKLVQLLQIAKTEMNTLQDAVPLLRYYFETPAIGKGDVDACIPEANQKKVHQIISDQLKNIAEPVRFLEAIKVAAKNENIPLKELLWIIRLALYGSTKGPGVGELIEVLGKDVAKKRIEDVLSL